TLTSVVAETPVYAAQRSRCHRPPKKGWRRSTPRDVDNASLTGCLPASLWQRGPNQCGRARHRSTFVVPNIGCGPTFFDIECGTKLAHPKRRQKDVCPGNTGPTVHLSAHPIIECQL